jgi:hypothetical protein
MAYLFLSLAYSFISLAFQINFSGGVPNTSTGSNVTPIEYGNPAAYGRGTFVVYWMLNWVGMMALGLACENVAMFVGQPWYVSHSLVLSSWLHTFLSRLHSWTFSALLSTAYRWPLPWGEQLRRWTGVFGFFNSSTECCAWAIWGRRSNISRSLSLFGSTETYANNYAGQACG